MPSNRSGRRSNTAWFVLRVERSGWNHVSLVSISLSVHPIQVKVGNQHYRSLTVDSSWPNQRPCQGDMNDDSVSQELTPHSVFRDTLEEYMDWYDHIFNNFICYEANDLRIYILDIQKSHRGLVDGLLDSRPGFIHSVRLHEQSEIWGKHFFSDFLSTALRQDFWE